MLNQLIQWNLEDVARPSPPFLGAAKGVKSLIMGILATPPKATPPKNKALLRAY